MGTTIKQVPSSCAAGSHDEAVSPPASSPQGVAGVVYALTRVEVSTILLIS
jgi:hypothetical protein